jgi:hypothetical protein
VEGAPLVQRADDTEKVFAERMRADRISASTFRPSLVPVARARRAAPLRDRIAQKLLESSLISQDQLARALESQQSGGGTLSYNLVNIYLIKMAAVFMFSTSTVITCTGISPRWVAYLGFVLALLLLFGSSYLSWVFVAFPFWVFLISICLLTDEFRRRVRTSSTKA